MKRFFAIVLAVVCCLSLSVTAFAQIHPIATPRYSHILSTTHNMTISGSTAKVSGKVRLGSGDSCEIIATIEQEVDGSWEPVKTFTVTADGKSVAMNKSWALYKGYSYRCTFQFNAYEGGELMESYEATTSEKWY